MLLPRMKLAVIFDRAFHAMADMHWRMLWILIAFHAASSWAMLGAAGETGLRAAADFL
ncbi:hypothetical protein [Brevundimonas viscosa]|uniref:hypothetical protein n=1 Tax=Brevundimonas viscosa TaxID=871741 RepID=UPI0015A647E2|nr:hypothetical protein [Brevundimonas viscosa]